MDGCDNPSIIAQNVEQEAKVGVGVLVCKRKKHPDSDAIHVLVSKRSESRIPYCIVLLGNDSNPTYIPMLCSTMQKGKGGQECVGSAWRQAGVW